jgi:hypothetical protein
MVAEGAGKGANTVFKENNIVTTFGGKLLCSVKGAELGAWTRLIVNFTLYC